MAMGALLSLNATWGCWFAAKYVFRAIAAKIMLMVIFFLCGMFAFILAIQVFKPSRLLITGEGFSLSDTPSAMPYRWADIDSIALKIVQRTRGGPIWDLVVTFRSGILPRGRTEKEMGGNWNMSNNDLYALMQTRLEDYRTRHRG